MNSSTLLEARFSRAIWLVLALILSHCLPTQGQTNPPPPPSAARPWSWAATVQHPTLNGYLRGGQTATDAVGNQYITGSFVGKVAFGSTTLRSRSNQMTDLFVAKLSPTGQWLWAVSPAATTAPLVDFRSSQGVDVAVDGLGNVTVLAGYYGPLTLGSSVLPEPLTRSQSLVVARLSPQGQWLNTSVATTNLSGVPWGYTLIGTALSVDAQGNACILGYGAGTMSFGTYSVTGTRNNLPQSFAASVSSGGVWRWATAFADPITELVTARQVKAGPQGDFWVVGYFQLATATFGAFTVRNTVSGALSSEVFLAHLSAQGQWLGVYPAGGNGGDYANALTVDAQNNVYIAGSFNRSARFGSLRVNSLHPPSSSSGNVSDAFLAKLTAAGQWAWVQQGGGVSGVQGSGVALDTQGDVYWSGSCGDSSIFGPTTLRGSSTFFAKLSPTGQWRWAIGTPLTSTSPDIYLAPDPQDGIRVATVHMGRLALGPHILPSPADANVMGAHLSANGQWAWAAASASGGTATIRQVVADAQGNTYATGSFGGTVVLGSTTLTSRGYTDAFVISYDRQGRTRWATQLGTAAPDEGQLIALDPRGGLVLLGIAGDTLRLNTDVVTTPLGSNFPSYGNIGFLARLNRQGQVLGGVLAPQGVTRLAVAANGDAVLAGTFYTTIQFGSLPPLVTTGVDGFVARLSPTNQWRWVRHLHGPVTNTTDGVNDVVVDSAGNGYVTGYFSDSIQLGAFTVRGRSDQASYLASFDDAGQWRWARPINDRGTSEFLYTAGLALSPNGGQLLVSGYLTDSVSFGPVRLSGPSGVGMAFVGAMTLGGQWLGANIPTSGETLGGALASGATNSYMLGGFFGGARFGADSIDTSWGRLGSGPRPSAGPSGAHQRSIAGVRGGPPIPPPPTPFVTGFTGAGQWQWAQAMSGATTLAASSATDDLFVAGGLVAGDSAVTNGGATVTFQTLPIGYLTAMLGGPLGVRDAAAQPRLAMWPNPARHTLHLTAPPKGAQSVRVLDGVGRVVFTQAVTGAPTTLTLPLPALAPGMYIVQCGGLTNRLVVE